MCTLNNSFFGNFFSWQQTEHCFKTKENVQQFTQIKYNEQVWLFLEVYFKDEWKPPTFCPTQSHTVNRLMTTVSGDQFIQCWRQIFIRKLFESCENPNPKCTVWLGEELSFNYHANFLSISGTNSYFYSSFLWTLDHWQLILHAILELQRYSPSASFIYFSLLFSSSFSLSATATPPFPHPLQPCSSMAMDSPSYSAAWAPLPHSESSASPSRLAPPLLMASSHVAVSPPTARRRRLLFFFFSFHLFLAIPTPAGGATPCASDTESERLSDL